MNDFLTRLAGRALGTMPVAQPLISSTFTPGAEPGGISIVSEPGELRAGTEPAEAVPPVAPENLRSRVESRMTLPDLHTATSRAEPRVNSDVSPSRRAGHTEQPPPQLLEPRRTDAIVAVVADRLPVSKVPLPDSVPRREDVRTPQPPPVNELSRTVPARAAVPAASKASHQPSHLDRAIPLEPPPPVIRVTIGRVDVRAEFPTRAATVVTRRATAPALSLDDYLKQRNEGRR